VSAAADDIAAVLEHAGGGAGWCRGIVSGWACRHACDIRISCQMLDLDRRLTGNDVADWFALDHLPDRMGAHASVDRR
jgi:hypothetical protein